MITRLAKRIPDGCITPLQFDEWRAKELDTEQVRALEAHLQRCDRCRTRARALEVLAADFVERFPVEQTIDRARVADSGVRRVRAKRGQGPLGWGTGLAALAAAAAFALVMGGRENTSSTASGPSGTGPGPDSSARGTGTRFKGDARIGFFVSRGGRVSPGQDGETVQPGDKLRFVVATSRPRYLAILSRDGSSAATEYYPGDGVARQVSASRNLALESSVELDNRLGNESFWGVFSPFSTAPLLRTLEQQGALPVLPGCTVDRDVDPANLPAECDITP